MRGCVQGGWVHIGIDVPKDELVQGKETYEHPEWPAAIAIDPESGQASSVAREVHAQTNSLPVFIRTECGALQSNSKE